MAKGSYNISVSRDSHFVVSRKKKNDAGLKSQDCLDSCLSPAFLRSLSLHDQPRSSRVPTNKELRKSRYKTLVSSLDNLSSNPSPSLEVRSESSAHHDLESVRIDAEAGENPEASLSAAHQQTGSWFEEKHRRFSVESDNLLEKTVAILRTLDEDISESLTNLTKPESIALESLIEIYRNKVKSSARSSAGFEFDLSTETSSEPIYENWQPIQIRSKDVQAHSTPRRQHNLQAQSPRQSHKNSPAQTSEQSSKNLKAQSSQQSPKNLKAQSSQQSPKNLKAHSSQQSPKILKAQSSQQSPKILKAQSSQQSPKNLKAQSSQQSPKNLKAHSSEQSPKNLLVQSAQKTLNFESPSSNFGNTQSSTKPNSDLRSVEESPRNVLSTSKTSSDASKTESLIEFDLPSDHEQCIKIIGALQNRCLEYREMVQDIAVSALEECLNFSKLSVSRILGFRKQFRSQKRNFRDFKELCCNSVVFGPDCLPIDEKVTEVIQSFYLKLLQEENETFMVRLDFGLKMAEVYSKMLNFEAESQKMVTTLEKEILYLKKTSVGFKV